MTAQLLETTTHPTGEPDGWRPRDATARTGPRRHEPIVTDTMHSVAIGIRQATIPGASPPEAARPGVPAPPGTRHVRREPWR
ncbi:hypothetical protein DER29_1034 [Micromonospora sp. M71_S20]|nr:hypothetical protein DER29_1034 [Micromonospora sp. M71_S20]